MHPSPVTSGYRTKMEYSFWYEEDGLHIALHKRGSPFIKVPLREGSELASPAMNEAALAIVKGLDAAGVTKHQLKCLVIRESKTSGGVHAALYVTDIAPFISVESAQADTAQVDTAHVDTAQVDTAHVDTAQTDSTPQSQTTPLLPFNPQDIPHLSGFTLVYSDPKSPAAVTTEILHEWKNQYLEEVLNGLTFRYAYDGFFQNNVPLFLRSVEDIAEAIRGFAPDNPVIAELYSGIGTIGILLVHALESDRTLHKQTQTTRSSQNNLPSHSATTHSIIGIESEPHNTRLCIENIQRNNISHYQVIQSKVEDIAPEQLKQIDVLILDPPRPGMHEKAIEIVAQANPKLICYLSCNPKTQVRDIQLIMQKLPDLRIQSINGYDFYPHTFHLESLVVMSR